MLRACFALVDFVDLIPVRIARTPECFPVLPTNVAQNQSRGKTLVMKAGAFGTSYGHEFLELAGFLRSDAGFLKFDCDSMTLCFGQVKISVADDARGSEKQILHFS